MRGHSRSEIVRQLESDKEAMEIALRASMKGLLEATAKTREAMKATPPVVPPTSDSVTPPAPKFSTGAIPPGITTSMRRSTILVDRIWLVAILKSLGGSIVIDQHQMLDAEGDQEIELDKTADPPTWIMRLGERHSD